MIIFIFPRVGGTLRDVHSLHSPLGCCVDLLDERESLYE